MLSLGFSGRRAAFHMCWCVLISHQGSEDWWGMASCMDINIATSLGMVYWVTYPFYSFFFLEGEKLGKELMDIFTPKLLTPFYVSVFGPKAGIFPLPMSLRGTWTSRLGSESSPAHVELKGFLEKLITFLGFFRGALGTEDMCTSCFGGKTEQTTCIYSLPIIQWEKNEKWWRIYTWQMLMIFGIIKSVDVLLLEDILKGSLM